MSTLRVAVLGCGSIARSVHLRVLHARPDVRIVAVADADPRNLELAQAGVPGVMACADYRTALDGGSVDAVAVCLPTALHADAAIAAFDAGVHVYLEKPIASTMPDAVRLLRAWKASGRVGMTGFNFRFHPQLVEIGRRARAGDIGTVVGLRTVFTVTPHDVPGWKRSRSSGGGVLLDLASHHVDLARSLLSSEVSRVFASVRSLDSEQDHAALQLEMTDGVLVQIFVSLAGCASNRIELSGTAGRLVFDRTELQRADFAPATTTGARAHRIRRALTALGPRTLFASPGREPSFERALGAFVRAALADGTHLGVQPDLLCGARSLAVIEAAERSLVTGAAMEPELVVMPEQVSLSATGAAR